MLEGLRYALDQTGYLWARDGWSKPPKGDYGVYSVTDQAPMRADNDSAAEIMLQGFVDYFTSAKTLAPKNAIENALRSIGLSWKLESIQFEPSTGYTHYEWSWTDTSGKADMCVIRFVAHDSETVQLVRRGEMPEPPKVAPFKENGLWKDFLSWDYPVEPANENTTYTAEYRYLLYLWEERDRWRAYTSETYIPDWHNLTTVDQDQVWDLIQWDKAGGSIYAAEEIIVDELSGYEVLEIDQLSVLVQMYPPAKAWFW